MRFPLIVTAVKRLWHTDLAADPVAHAWALNLYRAGERHPQTVADYFPANDAPDPELAGLLRRHQADEERHTKMYAALIEGLGGRVLDDVDDGDVYNHQIRQAGGDTFGVREGDSPNERRRKLGHFLLHAHFLEARIAQSVAWHKDACEGLDSGTGTTMAPVIARVQEDEERHVDYTARWAQMLLTGREFHEARDLHRRAEAAANWRFSARQCRTWVARHGQRPDRRALYTACAWFMERMAG